MARLVVGLGNPGHKYTHTRHNAGFLALDAYLSDVTWSQENSSLVFRRNNIIFCKPMTFMNLSGESVSHLKGYFGIAHEDILVVCDDLYLPEGIFRFGFNRGSGGHNGLKNIIRSIGGRNFCTLRIGIGPREKAHSIADYVLEQFSKESMDRFKSMFPSIFSALREFEEGMNIAQLQNKYNG